MTTINLNGKKILVVCLDNLGDTVNSTAVIHPIKSQFPESRLFFWVKEPFKHLLDEDPRIDEVYGVNPFWLSSPHWKKGNIITYCRHLMRLKKERFDVAIIINACWRKSASLLFIPLRIGVSQKKSRLFLTRAVPEAELTLKHRKYTFQRLLELLGIHTEILNSKIYFPQSQKNFLEHFLRRYDIARKPVCNLHIFSADMRRNWPPERYCTLIEQLKRKYPAMLFLISSGASEQAPLEPFFGKLPGVIFTATTLMEITALISRSCFFFGPDSGPLNVASALGVPTVSFYQYPPAWKASPLGDACHISIEKDKITDLSVQEVLEKIETLEPIWKTRLF